jgi:hypothetical protein
MKFLVVALIIVSSLKAFAQPTIAQLKKNNDEYIKVLADLRERNKNHRRMPAIRFFLFGMGDRLKMIYKNGTLLNAVTGDTIGKWKVQHEVIYPSEYAVSITTPDNYRVLIYENEDGVFIREGKRVSALSRSRLSLPRFAGKKWAPVLRVLHHEVLINIINGKPVPNFFVYTKPWYRDAALMGMVLKETRNLGVVRDWIMNIRDPFDRNNHGISEADNPGEVLFLVSLVSDSTHPVVRTVMDSSMMFIKKSNGKTYLEGKTDYSLHPVYQTKWMKYGLKALGMKDSFDIPIVYDNYSSLFWWDYKSSHVAGKQFNEQESKNYPYLVWAEDHFFGEKKGFVSDQTYPLTWEAFASDAHYPGMKMVDEQLVTDKMSIPHTWHAAEMFLLLVDE